MGRIFGMNKISSKILLVYLKNYKLLFVPIYLNVREKLKVEGELLHLIPPSLNIIKIKKKKTYISSSPNSLQEINCQDSQFIN